MTVTGVDDPVDDDDRPSTITATVVDASSDDAFDGLADQTVSVTTVDDDEAGLALADTLATTVSESGTSDPFTVVLTTQPSSNVFLDVSSSDPEEATVSPTTLTFSPVTWDLPQTVTVTATPASDPTFAGLADTVAVTTTDDDVAGLEIVAQGGTTVTESGSTDVFTVALTAQPGSNVVVDVVSLDTDEATVSPARLTFTPGDWDGAQTVTVTGVDDPVADGDAVTDVTITVDNAVSDDAFDNLADTLQVTTTDDDDVGFDIFEPAGTTVTEAEGLLRTDRFYVELTSQPGSDVVLTVTSADTTEALVAVLPAPFSSQLSLTFTPDDWDVAQEVTVSGVDDLLVDGDQTAAITIAVDTAQSDVAYDTVASRDVLATTEDDDVAGFTVTESDGSTTTVEGGATDTFDVVLTRGPLTPVVFGVSSAGSEVSVSAPSLTFDTSNWATPQTVTVSAVDDFVDDGDQTRDVTISVVDASSDPAFRSLPDTSVSATAIDNDTADVVLSTTELTVTEDPAATPSATFTVRLDSEPTADVFVGLTGSAEFTLEPDLTDLRRRRTGAPPGR